MNKQETEKVDDQNQPQEEQHTEATIQLINEDKITELQSKIDELNDKYLRLYSEFDNFRKRTAKEKIELIQSASENAFKIMLPIVDDFDRAIKSNLDLTDAKVISDGVNLIYSKFKGTLSQKGLEEMKSIGEPFNTDLHEAITNVPAPSEDLKGKIIEVLEKGYMLNGRVIRFAKVVIGS
ncbi:MAG: nucleotide exchange factor GrpE [Bacteroidetes bacterium]|nr:nucleotide exchange factor GrpE [Bacteroidota bacterium]